LIKYLDAAVRAMVVKPASDFSAEHGVSFVSVTQQFNTTTSMGRLTLNVLLSFAQFEREITSERIRDKIASSKRKGLWVGGMFVSGARAGRGGRWCARGLLHSDSSGLLR
jgi:hypothetical protein